MSKKRWILVILVVAFISYLIISKVNPEAGWGIDNVVGGQLGTLKAGIEASWLWQTYDIWIAGGFFAIVTFLLTWKGRDIKDSITGVARVRATEGGGLAFQTNPTVQPQQIPAGPQAAPVVVEQKKDQQ